MTSINLKPGAFGQSIRTTHNPIFALFMTKLSAHQIKYRTCSPKEYESVFTFPSHWTHHNGKKGKARAMKIDEYQESKRLDIKMEVSEIRFDGNIAFTWCGALVLEREDMLDPESAEAQAITDIWQEV